MRKGTHHSEETKNKLSLSGKGRKPNSGSFKKGQASPLGMLGKKHTEESKRKIGDSSRGRISPMKGREHSTETKLRMSNTRKKQLEEGTVTAGHPQTDKTKAKISKASRKHWSSEDYRNKVLSRRDMSGLEEKFLRIVERHNLPYKFVGNGAFSIERKVPDFINTNGKKIAIEVFYKKHKDQFRGGLEEWKRNRTELFRQYGWDILYFDAVEINEENIIKRLKSEINPGSDNTLNMYGERGVD